MRETLEEMKERKLEEFSRGIAKELREKRVVWRHMVLGYLRLAAVVGGEQARQRLVERHGIREDNHDGQEPTGQEAVPPVTPVVPADAVGRDGVARDGHPPAEWDIP